MRQRWDKDKTCLLLEMYKTLRDDDILAQLIEAFEPFVHIVTSTEVNRNVSSFHFDVLKYEALEQLFISFKEGIRFFPTDDTTRFTRYMWSVVKNEIYRSAKRNADSTTVDFGSMCCGYAHRGSTVKAPLLYGRQLNYKDVNNKLVLAEYRRDTLIDARSKIRFTGVEKQICSEMLDIMVGGSSLDPFCVGARFGVGKHRTQFFVQYCYMLLRQARYLLGAVVAF